MSVTHYGHGVYCYRCQDAHESTDDCEHRLQDMAGIQKGINDEFTAQKDSMGHHSPCMFHEVDGMEMCLECEKVKIPNEMVKND